MSNNLVLNMFREKCPNCGIGNVFVQPENTFSIPETKKQCDHCFLTFEREPGFFIGAMYVSYGLAVFQAVLTYVVMGILFPESEVQWVLGAITMVIILFSKKNFKWARILYIRIFLKTGTNTTKKR